ncbi:hypothetical protein V1264_011799 [Littorina saxatilis]|uniref:Uncharacterized protein n=2 Tax=Littorina saxatilis TaxID=31220 RepID=A0AAN9GKM7_9CAEN
MMRVFVVVLICVVFLSGADPKKNTKHSHVLKRQETGGCRQGEFQCHSGAIDCVQEEWTCDSQSDCEDNSDETLPQCPPPNECTGPHEILCKGTGNCVPLEYRCDGDRDCLGGDDEAGCDLFQCSAGEVKCSNNVCIETQWMCDNQDDCKNGWDELPENCKS